MTRSRDIATAISKAVQAGTLTATGALGVDAVLDSSEVQAFIDSSYVRTIVDGTYIQSNVDQTYIQSNADQAYVRSQINLAYINSLDNPNVQFNQEGTLAVTTGTARWYAPRNITINKIEGFLGTAGTGATTFATLVNGSSSRTDSISSGATTSSTTGLSISVNDGQYLTVNITAIGTNAADLSVKFYYT